MISFGVCTLQVLPPTSLLGGHRAKQRLQAFKAAKGGNVSFGLQKLTRTVKRASKFEEEDEEEKEEATEKEERDEVRPEWLVEEKQASEEEEVDVSVSRNLPPEVTAAARNIEAAMMGVTVEREEKVVEQEETKTKAEEEVFPKENKDSKDRKRRSGGRDGSSPRRRGRRSRSRENRRSSRRRSRSRSRDRRSSRRRSRSRERRKDLAKAATSWASLRAAGVDVTATGWKDAGGGRGTDPRTKVRRSGTFKVVQFLCHSLPRPFFFQEKFRNSMVMVSSLEVHPFIKECETRRISFEVSEGDYAYCDSVK